MHKHVTTSGYRDGRELGRRWASEASAEEIQRVSDADDGATDTDERDDGQEQEDE